MKSHFSFLLIFFLLLNCQPKTSQEIQSEVLLETTKSWDGNLLSKIEGQPKVTISRVRIPPGKELPKHLHPVITTGILTKGQLTVTTAANDQITIKEGDVLVEVSNTIHFGKNSGTTDAEILVFYIGDEDLPTTILEKR